MGQHFGGSTGYGHDEGAGREALDNVFAEIVGAEAAIVRSQVLRSIQALNPSKLMNAKLFKTCWFPNFSFSLAPTPLPVPFLHSSDPEMRLHKSIDV